MEIWNFLDLYTMLVYNYIMERDKDFVIKRTPRIYEPIDFPPLTEEQKRELEALSKMKDEDIDFSDIPPLNVSEFTPYYAQPVDLKKIETEKLRTTA